jgi:hypothetical protein
VALYYKTLLPRSIDQFAKRVETNMFQMTLIGCSIQKVSHLNVADEPQRSSALSSGRRSCQFRGAPLPVQQSVNADAPNHHLTRAAVTR